MRRLHPQALVALGLIVVAVVAIGHTLHKTTYLALAVVIPSIILHELSHGVVAWACGDDTAKRAGRITLNPIKHVDPIGTLLVPGLLSLSGLGLFGWAKPVPVNPARLRHPRDQHVIVSLAGPATNLALAAISILALRFARPAGTAHAVDLIVNAFGVSALDTTDEVLYLLGFINVTLAVFNALPIPPLDGSAVVERFLPRQAWPMWIQVRRYAMPALLIVVLLGRNQLALYVFEPAERAWAHLLG